jgi:methylated-DNA-[protein]-cysteine S-methyltransferase
MTVKKQTVRAPKKPAPKKDPKKSATNATTPIVVAEHPHLQLTVHLFVKNDKIYIKESDIEPHSSFAVRFINNNTTVEQQELAKEKVIEWCKKYSEKKHETFPLPFEMPEKSAFFSKFINELAIVPFGKTVTYQDLSVKVNNNNKASRAIGNACNQNPFPLIVPCHRVLAAKQGLGGFGSGVELKKVLLSHESIKWN